MSNILPSHIRVLADRSWMGRMVAVFLALCPPISKAVSLPYEEWITPDGTVKVEKRKQLEPLLQMAGVYTDRVQTRSPALFQSWHIGEISKLLQKIEYLPVVDRNRPIFSTHKAHRVIALCEPLLHLKKGIPITNLLTPYEGGFLLLGSSATHFYKTVKFLNRAIFRLDPKEKLNIKVYVLTKQRPLQKEELQYLEGKLKKDYLERHGGDWNKCDVSLALSQMKDETDMIMFFLRRRGWISIESKENIPIRNTEFFYNDQKFKPSWQSAEDEQVFSRDTTQYHMIVGKDDPERKGATIETIMRAWTEYMERYPPLGGISGKKFLLVSEAPFIDYQWQRTKNICNALNIDCTIVGVGRPSGAGRPWVWCKKENANKKLPFPKGEEIRRASVALDALARLCHALNRAHEFHEISKAEEHKKESTK